MTKVTYVTHDHIEHVVDVKPGFSIMEGAVRHEVPGIDADCGGSCSCATCHVFVDERWLHLTGERTPMEAAILDFADGVAPNSRLSCQIEVSDDLDGIVVRLPEHQNIL